MTDIKQDVSTVKHDRGHMRQEWKHEIRQEVSTGRHEISNYRQESTSSIRNLENQMAQVTKTITERARGALPSTTENNPRERVQAITLRSGKELPDPVLHKGSTSKSPNEEENVKIHVEENVKIHVEENAEQNTGTVAPAGLHADKALEKGKEKTDVPVYRPPLPYPGRFSWGTTIACCEKNFELVDNNLVGCVNDESLDFDEFDNVDACACDAISAVENDRLVETVKLVELPN
nr:Aspartic peptidase [Ipomoea batatas]